MKFKLTLNLSQHERKAGVHNSVTNVNGAVDVSVAAVVGVVTRP